MTYLKQSMLMLVLVCLFAVGGAGTFAAETSIETQLYTYINALNQRDYLTAWNMLGSKQGGQTYEQFVAGYANTERIIPYFGHTGVAAGSAYVTTVLMGFQTDGTVENYYGYFRLANGGNFAPPISGYVLSEARFQPVQDGDALHHSVVQSLVANPWQETITIADNTGVFAEMTAFEADMLLYYYDAINRNDFTAALDLWATVANYGRTYRPIASTFASGYNDTKFVTVYVGFEQGATPQSTARSMVYVPAVLVSQHTDGSFETFAGCYALAQLADGTTRIVNGRFFRALYDAPNADTIFSNLNRNCASIGMGV